MLSEKISIKDIVFALLCISGVVLVVQPSFLFHSLPENQNESAGNISTKYSDNNTSYKNIILVTIGYLLPVITGMMVTGEALLIKKYSYIKDNITVVVFWSIVPSFTASAIAMAVLETPTLPSTWMDVLYVLGQNIGYTLLWVTIYFAAKYISGNTINMILCTSVVFMLLAQYTVLSSIHPGHRNWMEVLGAVLVFVGSSLKSVFEFFKFDVVQSG